MKIEEKSKKKATVRISKKDLLKLLSENEEMKEKIWELENSLHFVTDERDALLSEKKGKKIKHTEDAIDGFPDYEDEVKRAKIPSGQPAINEDEFLDEPFPDYKPEHINLHPEYINPNIYLDGAHGLGNGRRFGSNG